MASGEGGSLGEAILRAIASEAGGHIGMRKSYTAKGWHAQISKLTSSPRGYEAAAMVGLSATRETLKKWLAEEQTPTAENQRKIAAAYRIMAGAWPSQVERKQISITGRVKIGRDDRDRGSRGSAPFLVDGSAGDWAWLKQKWESGEKIDPSEVEEWFTTSVVEADLGEGSYPWEFPGDSYGVSM